jgi:hypothetical protein
MISAYVDNLTMSSFVGKLAVSANADNMLASSDCRHSGAKQLLQHDGRDGRTGSPAS